jgi:hypothetical protein
MFTFFVDESGITSDSRWFILSTTCIDGDLLKEVGVELDKIKTDFGLPPSIEIKWNLRDTNSILQKNNISPLTDPQHTEIKKKILKIVSDRSSGIKIYLYLSPRVWFSQQRWRSYDYALNVVLKKFKRLAVREGTLGFVLLDELSGLAAGLKKEEIRILLQTYIHNFFTLPENRALSLIIPQVNSCISCGHQINDIVAGLLNYYLQNYDKTLAIRSQIVQSIRSISGNIPSNFQRGSSTAVLNAGLFVYPQNPQVEGLQEMMQELYSYLGTDFGFI